MKTGTVKWFDSNKGYGFITDDSGSDIFVHQSNVIMQGYRTLEVDQVVLFDQEQAERGCKAINVTVQ